LRILLKERTPGQIEFGIIYGGFALIALVVTRFLPALTTVLPSCVFRGITGIPCPTCGATRAVMHLSRGDIIASLEMNPLVAIAVVSGMMYFIYSALTFLFNMRRITVIFADNEMNPVRLIVALTVAINWGYLVFAL
jgi:hypothetical protein